MSKMTDEQIIKALEKYKTVEDTDITTSCIKTILLKETYLLINRQQAEIERMNNNLSAMATTLSNSAKETGNEAIKVYMKILEEKLSQNTDISNVGYQSIIFDMEQGYKEMVGEGK